MQHGAGRQEKRMKAKKESLVQMKLAPDYHDKLKVIVAQMGRRALIGDVVRLWIDRYERENGWIKIRRVR